MRTTDFIDDVAENGLAGFFPFHLYVFPENCEDGPYLPCEFIEYLNMA
jgi:hypothetical protein